MATIIIISSFEGSPNSSKASASTSSKPIEDAKVIEVDLGDSANTVLVIMTLFIN